MFFRSAGQIILGEPEFCRFFSYSENLSSFCVSGNHSKPFYGIPKMSLLYIPKTYVIFVTSRKFDVRTGRGGGGEREGEGLKASGKDE